MNPLSFSWLRRLRQEKVEDCGRSTRPRRKWGRIGSTYFVGPPLEPTETGGDASSSSLHTSPFSDSLANLIVQYLFHSGLIFRRWSLVISLQLNHTAAKPEVKPWSYYSGPAGPPGSCAGARSRSDGSVGFSEPGFISKSLSCQDHC